MLRHTKDEEVLLDLPGTYQSRVCSHSQQYFTSRRARRPLAQRSSRPACLTLFDESGVKRSDGGLRYTLGSLDAEMRTLSTSLQNRRECSCSIAGQSQSDTAVVVTYQQSVPKLAWTWRGRLVPWALGQKMETLDQEQDGQTTFYSSTPNRYLRRAEIVTFNGAVEESGMKRGRASLREVACSQAAVHHVLC